MKTIINVVGPTAVGKTSLGIYLAKLFNTVVISADSRQFYKETTIGTAKPTKEELRQAKHYFINNKSIQEEYNAGDFERDSLKLINELEQEVIICVGGSGLYVNALNIGFDDIPETTVEVRAEINEEYQQKGITFLQEEIKKIDPGYAQVVDIQNPQRIIRGIEVYRTTGNTLTSYRQKNQKSRPFKSIFIGLNSDREYLYNRINKRVDLMLKEGLLEEAKNVYPFKHHPALKTVGYQELFSFFDGEIELEEAIELIKRNSRRYAKRQITWFKKTPTIEWFSPEQKKEIEAYLYKKINQ